MLVARWRYGSIMNPIADRSFITLILTVNFLFFGDPDSSIVTVTSLYQNSSLNYLVADYIDINLINIHGMYPFSVF